MESFRVLQFKCSFHLITEWYTHFSCLIVWQFGILRGHFCYTLATTKFLKCDFCMLFLQPSFTLKILKHPHINFHLEWIKFWNSTLFGLHQKFLLRRKCKNVIFMNVGATSFWLTKAVQKLPVDQIYFDVQAKTFCVLLTSTKNVMTQHFRP